MDENYLDDLLKGVSTNNQKNNSFDNNVEKDAGVDIDFSDLDDISLEELDDFDSLDFEDLDFDDIDFDDVDVTSLDSGKAKESVNTEFAPEKEEFNADALLSEVEPEEFADNASDDTANMSDMDALMSVLGDNEAEEATRDSDNSDNMSAADLDNFLADMLGDSDMEDSGATAPGLMDDVFAEADNQHMDDVESMDLDDLFSALGIDDSESSENNYTSGEASLDELFQTTMESSMGNAELADIEDISDKAHGKRHDGAKKTLSEILFGEPDEDDAEEERLLAEKKAKKELKKAEKQQLREAKNAQKQEKLAIKQKEDNVKKQEKNAKKQERQAELLAEYEAEKNEKKVPTFVVVLVFLLFIILGAGVLLGSQGFDYSQAIKKASNYFDRQRYRLAYDEVSGIKVKEEDEKLRDRIYTVMYVERLYESYENNMSLGRPDKALDSLIRGLDNYDEHYDEALELRIVEDINSCKEKIINALWNTYGLTEAEAYALMELEGQDYNDALLRYCEGLSKAGE